MAKFDPDKDVLDVTDEVNHDTMYFEEPEKYIAAFVPTLRKDCTSLEDRYIVCTPVRQGRRSFLSVFDGDRCIPLGHKDKDVALDLAYLLNMARRERSYTLWKETH